MPTREPPAKTGPCASCAHAKHEAFALCRLASVTKTFTATAVLELLDQKRLRLDDTLGTYIQGVPNGHLITIWQLLGMRSGVFNFIDDTPFIDAYNADPLLPSWQPQDVIPILQRRPPAFAPGAKAQYSDSNYILLGLLREKVTGQPAERFSEENVIAPLGLSETTFPTTAAMPTPFAHGYGSSFGPLKDFTYSTPAVPWTAGAIVSTVPDLTRYAKALATGALLTAQTQREHPIFGALPNAGGPRVGYGLGILQIGNSIGHDGSIFGYSNCVFYCPRRTQRSWPW